MRERSRRGEGHRLEQDLVDAATRLLIAATPPAAPSLRAVARECGVSPSAVYLHFSSQEQLARAVVTALFDALRRAIAEADEPGADPFARLTAMGRAYLHWAEANPGGYQLLFEAPDPAPPAGEDWVPGMDLLVAAASCFAQVRPGREEALRSATALWACWHGIVSLRRTKPAAPWGASAVDDVVLIVRALLAEHAAAGAPRS